MRFPFRWFLSALLPFAAPALQAAGADSPPSAFEGYRRFSDEKVVPWPATNRAVTPAGKPEGHGAQAPQPVAQPRPATSAPAAAGDPAQPAASAPAPAGGHDHSHRGAR